MKRGWIVVLGWMAAAGLMAGLAAAADPAGKPAAETEAIKAKAIPAAGEEAGKVEMKDLQNKHAVITTRFGEMEIEFLPDKAPQTVANFVKLAQSGFYNGTTFHRVIPGFMIQGGDPNSKDPAQRAMHGSGGPGYSIKAEFNDTKHVPGVVSMARSNDPDSAGSQFFVMVGTSTQLDNKYTAFGRLVRGQDVAQKIVSVERDARDNPKEPVPMQVKIVEIKK